MGSEQVKQLQNVAGKPVLAHTIRRLLSLEAIRYLVIPTGPELVRETREIVSSCVNEAGRDGEVAVDVIPGGSERMDSVRNGLLHLMSSRAEVVLVHDAVRPCFPVDPVKEAIDLAFTKGAAILGIPATDTVKEVRDGCVAATPDRSSMWLAQTPQVFRKDVMADAFQQAESSGFVATDDASVLEFAKKDVHVVRGSHTNIKITYPADLFYVEQWLHSDSER